MQDSTHITPAELELEPVVRIAAATTLRDAAEVMMAAGVDTLVVDTVPPSEITEHDLVRAFAAETPGDAPVAAAVRTAALFVNHNVAVDRIVDLMLRERRHAVIVVDHAGIVLGLLSLRVAVAVLFEGPPWLGALRVALHIGEPIPTTGVGKEASP